MSSGSKKKEPGYTCLSDAKASHTQRMWAEISSSAPHLLHSGLSDSHIRWRCLLRVLCTVRRPVTALGCVLLKDRNLALASRQGPEINSRPCLWVLPISRHHIQCWLTNQRLYPVYRLPRPAQVQQTIEQSRLFASSSAISLLLNPACPGIQHSTTACRVETSFNAFWLFGPTQTLFWRTGELSKPPDYQKRYSRTSLVYS